MSYTTSVPGQDTRPVGYARGWFGPISAGPAVFVFGSASLIGRTLWIRSKA